MSDPLDAGRVSRLRELGLSESAARAYLALLELGETGARDVARIAKIPLGKVYQTLDQLVARGLVSTELTIPRRYAPVPIGTFLEKLREVHRHHIRELDEAEPVLLDLFQGRLRESSSDRGGVRVVRGRAESLHAMRAVVASAQRDIVLLPTRGWPMRERHDLLVLREAAARGVAVRMVVHHERGPSAAPFFAFAEVRERAHAVEGADGACICVADAETLIVIHFVPDDGSTTRGADFSMVVGEAGLVAALRAQVESLWRVGRPVTSGRAP